jgi:hypothetical protein
MHLNTDTPDTFDAQEDAMLRRVVATSLVADPLTTIQAAVTNAQMLLGQDWTCEARGLMRELGLAPQIPQSLMRLA